LPRVEILLREPEQLPTRRWRCSKDSVQHPSRGPSYRQRCRPQHAVRRVDPRQPIWKKTLACASPAGLEGDRTSHLSGMRRERSPYLTGFRGLGIFSAPLVSVASAAAIFIFCRSVDSHSRLRLPSQFGNPDSTSSCSDHDLPGRIRRRKPRLSSCSKCLGSYRPYFPRSNNGGRLARPRPSSFPSSTLNRRASVDNVKTIVDKDVQFIPLNRRASVDNVKTISSTRMCNLFTTSTT